MGVLWAAVLLYGNGQDAVGGLQRLLADEANAGQTTAEVKDSIARIADEVKAGGERTGDDKK